MKNETYDNLIPNNMTRFWVNMLIVAAFSVETIFRYVLIVLNKIPVASDLSYLFMPAVFVVLIYFNYNSWIRYRVKQNDLVWIMAYMLVIAASYMFFPVNRIYIEQQWTLILMTVPMYYLLGIIFTPDKKTMEILALLAKGIIVIDILFVIYWQGAGNEMGTDAMARAYRTLPAVLFLIMCAFNRRKVLDWAWMIFAVIYQFTYGTRGPVIVVLAYILYFMLFKAKGLTAKKLVSVVLFVAFIIFYNTSAFDNMIVSMADWFESMGLSTRIFDHMQEETLADSTGRESIFNQLYDMIRQNPLGYGVMGEYPVLGGYAHNIFLQLMVHFGIPGGVIIILAFLYLLIRAGKNNDNAYARDFIVMFACITIFRGFVSGSWCSYYFPFIIGLCVQKIRADKIDS